MPTMNHALQLTLFETLDRRQANYTALYDLAPRFVNRTDPKSGDRLNAIRRDFDFAGETYRVTVTPARVSQPDGSEKDLLPGAREQLVEDVIRKFAAEKLHLGDQEEVLTRFSIYAVQKELAAHSHTFSRTEIKEAFQVLHLSNIAIMKIPGEGEKKAKPVVSAPAFPVLAFRDEADEGSTAFVQLNPLLAQAIKSLAYEQVNYEWMMQLRNPLARWVFKSISLLMAEDVTTSSTMEIKASDIINSFGHSRSRWRETLLQVEKAIDNLKDISAIADYVKTDIREGRKKVDTIFSVRFSNRFIEDRALARRQGELNETEVRKRVGNKPPDRFLPISSEEAAQIKLEKIAITSSSASQLSH